MKIFITGASGFIGKSYISHINNQYEFTIYRRGQEISINEDVVLHFAGKSPDLKETVPIDEYYFSNYELTKDIYDSFLISKAKTFIFLSSIKAVAENYDGILTEKSKSIPVSHYGKSKLLAEDYIISNKPPINKRVFILRPTIVHGPGNRGNLFSLFKLIENGFPWPFKKIQNKRSYLSIKNLCFIIDELITNDNIDSDIFNITDDEAISTNKLVEIISDVLNKKTLYLSLPEILFSVIGRIGDLLNLPINTNTFSKLTDSFVISNNKLISKINKPLPLSAVDGLKLTFESFKIEKK